MDVRYRLTGQPEEVAALLQRLDDSTVLIRIPGNTAARRAGDGSVNVYGSLHLLDHRARERRPGEIMPDLAAVQDYRTGGGPLRGSPQWVLDRAREYELWNEAASVAPHPLFVLACTQQAVNAHVEVQECFTTYEPRGMTFKQAVEWARQQLGSTEAKP